MLLRDELRDARFSVTHLADGSVTPGNAGR